MKPLAKRVADIITAADRGESPYIIAIDGRCASGKTTLAGELCRLLECNVIHADDFFLRPEQRTAERLSEPGGNFDRERFLSEVLLPLSEGKTVAYRPFDCKSMALCEPILPGENRISIIEGAYCTHPELRGYYSLTIFLDVEREEQMKRIRRRGGEEAARAFAEKWIPLEERYFDAFGTKNLCDFIFTN